MLTWRTYQVLEAARPREREELFASRPASQTYVLNALTLWAYVWAYEPRYAFDCMWYSWVGGTGYFVSNQYQLNKYVAWDALASRSNSWQRGEWMSLQKMAADSERRENFNWKSQCYAHSSIARRSAHELGLSGSHERPARDRSTSRFIYMGGVRGIVLPLCVLTVYCSRARSYSGNTHFSLPINTKCCPVDTKVLPDRYVDWRIHPSVPWAVIPDRLFYTFRASKICESTKFILLKKSIEALK